ncbi:MAG: flagellar basal body P-ring formation protein FlgA [Rhodospirillales bacterium]|nr:flagellar basal body P-ring formation protein FlgA [Rhodospirillales bacterium]
MKKIAVAIFVTALLVPVAVWAGEKPSKGAAPTYEAKVTLNEAITVKGKLVRLGDLFTNTGKKADITVAYAPAPGKRAVFDARWLSRVARTYSLDWRAVGLQDQIIVERDSQIITREEIIDHVRAALIDRGVDPAMTIELSNRLMKLHIPGDAKATVSVEDVAYEKRTGRFTAVLIAPAGSPAATRTRVTGRLFMVSEVPVPNRRILTKELIGKGDIKWIQVRQDRLRRDTILDANELIGKAAKRGLRSGIPVQISSVQRPILVPRGSLVTILLKTPKMTITAQGKSLENGSEGDVIKITNTQSKTVIEAEVIGNGKVAVLASNLMAMN